MERKTVRHAACLGLLLALGCGSHAATTAHPTAEPESTMTAAEVQASMPAMPATLTAPPTPWAEMTHEDKGKWMHDHVVPTMAPLFREFDATRYAEMRCATCHGPEARARNFAMPSGALPVLPRPGSPEWEQLQVAKPRTFAFMATRVELAMAGTLGLEPYNPATNQGFGCFQCHTMSP